MFNDRFFLLAFYSKHTFHSRLQTGLLSLLEALIGSSVHSLSSKNRPDRAFNYRQLHISLSPFLFPFLADSHYSQGHQESCISNSHPLVIPVSYLKVLYWSCSHVLWTLGLPAWGVIAVPVPPHCPPWKQLCCLFLSIHQSESSFLFCLNT